MKFRRAFSIRAATAEHEVPILAPPQIPPFAYRPGGRGSVGPVPRITKPRPLAGCSSPWASNFATVASIFI